MPTNRHEDSDGAAVRRGIAANLVAGVFVIAANFAAIPLGIGIAGPSAFGAWTVAFSFVLLLSQADLGLGASLIRQLAFLRTNSRGQVEEGNAAWSGLILFSLAGIAASAIAGIAIVVYYFSTPADITTERMTLMSGGAAVGVLAGMLGRYFVAVIQSHQEFWAERSATVIGQAVRLGTLVLIPLSALNVDGLTVVVIADLLAVVLSGLLSAGYVLSRRRPPRWAGFRQSRQQRTALLKFGAPTFVSGFTSLLAMQAPLWIVGALVGLAEAAGFGALARIYQSSRTVLGWITGPLLPAASRASAFDDTAGLSRLHWRGLILTVFVGGSISSVLIAGGGELLSLWLGPEYTYLNWAAAAIGLSIVINAIYAPGVVVATGIGRPGLIAWLNVALLVTTIAFCIPGALIAGSTGAAAAISIAGLTIFPLIQSRTSNLSGLRLTAVTLLPASAAAVAALVSVIAMLVFHLQGLPGFATLVLCAGVATSISALSAFALKKAPETWILRA